MSAGQVQMSDAQEKALLARINTFCQTPSGNAAFVGYSKEVWKRIEVVSNRLLNELSDRSPWGLWSRLENIKSDYGKDDTRIQEIWLDDSLRRSSLRAGSGYIDLIQAVNNGVYITKEPPVGEWHGHRIKGRKDPMYNFREYHWFITHAFHAVEDFARQNGVHIGYSRSYIEGRNTPPIYGPDGDRDPVDAYIWH